VTVLADAKKFIAEGDSLQVSHMVFGGAAVRVEKAAPISCWLSQLWHRRSPAAGRRPEGRGRASSLCRAEMEGRPAERKPRPPSPSTWPPPKRWFAPARHCQEEDLEMIFDWRACSKRKSALPGRSRRLDWLATRALHRVSGAVVKPDLYLGVGFLAGAAHRRITEAHHRRHHKDGEAPIFPNPITASSATLPVVPALINALKARSRSRNGYGR